MINNEQRIGYRRGRAKLVGMHKTLPISFIVVLIGIALYSAGSAGMTPASVSVRGYTRSDGTYVRPYSRRPPGSVARDKPYVTQKNIGFLLIIGGVLIAWRTGYRYRNASDDELLPHVVVNISPPSPVRVPDKCAKSRKTWSCLDCERPIFPSDTYYYREYWTDSYPERERYCKSCSDSRKEQHIALEHELIQYRDEVHRLREAQYEEYFGPIRSKVVSD